MAKVSVTSCGSSANLCGTANPKLNDMAPTRRKETPWTRYFVGVGIATTIVLIGLVIEDRKSMGVHDRAQDERITRNAEVADKRHVELSERIQAQQAELTRRIDLLITRFDSLQGYPNSVGALKKDIIDEVETKFKNQNDLLIKRMDLMESSFNHQLKLVAEQQQRIGNDRQPVRSHEQP